MTNIPTESVAYDTTEGLLYRALCVLIERSNGHVEISLEDLDNVGGRFMMGVDEADSLILTIVKGENEREH